VSAASPPSSVGSAVRGELLLSRVMSTLTLMGTIVVPMRDIRGARGAPASVMRRRLSGSCTLPVDSCGWSTQGMNGEEACTERM
jgi:hypothetical protein